MYTCNSLIHLSSSTCNGMDVEIIFLFFIFYFVLEDNNLNMLENNFSFLRIFGIGCDVEK